MTFVDELDQILGGGVACGELTEICGPPGCGKTQLVRGTRILLLFSVNSCVCFSALSGDAVGSECFFAERVGWSSWSVSTLLNKYGTSKVLSNRHY